MGVDGGQYVRDWRPEGTHADYVSVDVGGNSWCVPDVGNEPVVVTKMPESFGPARNRVQRKMDPDTGSRDHL